MDSFKNIDLQVNGWGGVDFSSCSLTLKGVCDVTTALADRETVGYLATTITADHKVYEHVLPILAEAMETSECRDRLLGIHLEGPFISSEDGAVGAHPKAHVRAPSIEYFKRLQDLAGGHIRMMTLAPEQPGALDLVEYLVENKVVVSIGHTAADSGHIRDACKAGATLATHLGNGISNQLNRTENTLWAILASPLSVMLITDGFHLPPNFTRTVYAAKGAGRIILTSDAAPVAGLEPGEYEIFGTRVRLTEEGCVRNLNAPTLAGSAADLAHCAKVCKEVLGIDDSELEEMCFGNAAALLEI